MGPARLELYCNGQPRGVAQMTPGQDAVVESETEQCVHRAQIVVAAEGAFGVVERTAAIRLLPSPGVPRLQ